MSGVVDDLPVTLVGKLGPRCLAMFLSMSDDRFLPAVFVCAELIAG